ncbi:hypothetical protein, partial [Levilactobacillus brevis]|uniref:hypothetical protein n=1 Tax=Levilactobacillus brevis TaxID=1580 RepID=UPI001BDF2043
MADESDVPGAITTSFIRGRTIQKINKEGIQEYSDWVYSKVSEEKMKTEKIKLTENKFFSYLGTEQLEDLTYIWLYDKYGYIVIPSTNKKGTQLYEFVLLN